MKRLVLFAAAAVMMAVLSCSKDSPKKKSDPKEQKSEAVIPAAGGSVELAGGVTLEVPGGAVGQDQIISLNFSQSAELINAGEYEGPVDGSSLKLPGSPLARMVFGPEGLQFDEPVTVEFPCSLPADQIDVLYYNAATGQWVSQGPVNVSEGKGRFTIRHFSTYVAVRLSMAPMSRVENYVMNGLRGGSSADEIAAAFHEWAVNGDGRQLMRRPYKNPGNGLFYEPFYSFCSVAWCVYADGIESNPDASGLHEIGVKPENSSFCGVFQLASYFSGYDSSEQLRIFINGTTVEEKRSNQTKLFDTMVEIFYRLAKPDIQLSPSKQIQKKGDEATVTVDLSVFDQVQNGPLPYEGVKLEVSSSDPSVVSISKSEITTDGSGKATFKIKALKDEGSSTISVKFLQRGRLWSGGPDDYAEAVKTLEVSLGEAWELEFSCNYNQVNTGTVDDAGHSNPQCNNPQQRFACTMEGNARFSVSWQKGKVGDIYAGAMPASYYAGYENQEVECYKIVGKANISVPSSSVTLSLPEVRSSYTYSDGYSTYTVSRTTNFSVEYHLNPRVDIEFAQVIDNLDKGIIVYFVSPFELASSTSSPSYYKDRSVLYFSGDLHYTEVDSEDGSTENYRSVMNEGGYYLYVMVPNMLCISLTEGTFPLTCYAEDSTDADSVDIGTIMFNSDPHYNYLFLDAVPLGNYCACVGIKHDHHTEASGSITLRKAGKKE